MGAIVAASPVSEKAAVTFAFFVVAYIAISVPVIGLGLMAGMTSLKTTGITSAAVMGSLAELALVCCFDGKGPRGGIDLSWFSMHFLEFLPGANKGKPGKTSLARIGV